jgi:hypothetical protein
MDNTHNSLPIKIVTVIYEYNWQCLTIVGRQDNNGDNISNYLNNQLPFYGIQEYIQSDNSPKFTIMVVRSWFEHIGANKNCLSKLDVPGIMDSTKVLTES